MQAFFSSSTKPKVRQGPPEILPNEITIVRKIGEGCFGTVYEGICRTIRVAVKIPLKQRLTKKGLETFKREIEIMSQINHPNVCLFLGAVTIEGSIRIVTELLAGDVESLLFSSKQFTLHERLKWAKDAAQGVAWLHGLKPNQLIHRDLKISNLLFDDSGRVKVCDFGLAQFHDHEIKDQKPKGTPLYMAPEVLRGDEITEKVDVYSFGIILWEMYSRVHAFTHFTDYETFRSSIISGERPPVNEDCLPALKALMERAWDPVPARRPSFVRIVNELDKVMEKATVAEQQLAVQAALRDPLACQLWCCAFLSLTEVDWKLFVGALYAHLQLMLPDDTTSPIRAEEPKDKDSSYAATVTPSDILSDEERRYQCLKALLVDSSSKVETVSLTSFGRALAYFGPLQFPHVPGGFLDKIREMLLEPWFHGSLSTNDTDRKLAVHQPGTFLIRFSNRSIGSYCISKVNRERKIIHIVVPREPEGFRFDGKIYSRFSDLIAENAEKHHFITPCPGSSFSWLAPQVPMSKSSYSVAL